MAGRCADRLVVSVYCPGGRSPPAPQREQPRSHPALTDSCWVCGAGRSQRNVHELAALSRVSLHCWGGPFSISGRQSITSIEGLDPEFDFKKILKHMKRNFKCNGAVMKDKKLGCVIQLQGDQRTNAFNFMADMEVSHHHPCHPCHQLALVTPRPASTTPRHGCNGRGTQQILRRPCRLRLRVPAPSLLHTGALITNGAPTKSLTND